MHHRTTMRLYYVERRQPLVICRELSLRWAGFETWMFHCREATLNILRSIDS